MSPDLMDAPAGTTPERQVVMAAVGQAPSAEWVIVTRGLTREYDMGGEIVRALRGVDLAVKRNEYVAIMGPSGSGKSTLMNIVGCLDTPNEGEYWLNGQLVQDAVAGQMFHGVPRIVATLSRGTTLLEGTIILTGSPAGVGSARTPPLFLKQGDTVEVEIAGVGRVRNPVRELS